MKKSEILLLHDARIALLDCVTLVQSLIIDFPLSDCTEGLSKLASKLLDIVKSFSSLRAHLKKTKTEFRYVLSVFYHPKFKLKYQTFKFSNLDSALTFGNYLKMLSPVLSVHIFDQLSNYEYFTQKSL